jgi:hypothetical protein
MRARRTIGRRVQTTFRHQRREQRPAFCCAAGSATQENTMNIFFKSALLTATIAGAVAFAAAPASAQIGVSIGIGGPVGVPGYAPCGPGYGPCGEGYNPYEGDYYYDPIFFDGAWYHGPYRWRTVGSERVFWINGGWHRNEWTRGAYPASMEFRNGGFYRGGRYDGFGNADRINARFHTTADRGRGMRPDVSPDRGSTGPDHGSMGQDHPDTGGDRQAAPHDDGPHNDGPHN